MKACIRCGAPLEDQANFCNHCGSGQQVAPQYQQPYPQYQQPYPQYAPNTVPAQPFVPKFGSIALFHFLAALVVSILTTVANAIATGIGIAIYAGAANWLLRGFYNVVYILFVGIGFSLYNKKCVRAGYPQKKLPVLCVAIPWALRGVFSFVFSMLFSIIMPIMMYEVGMPMVTVSIFVTVWNLVTLVLNALLTWLITLPILKAIVKKR